MAEPNDSAEVREFMAVFQKLRVLIDDLPELLESEAADNEPLTNLCMDVWNAAYSLHMAERSARRLFTAPTNPEFVTHWRDYEARCRLPLGNIAFLNAFGAAPAPAVVAAREKSHWEIVASGAAANAKAIRATVEHARIDAETFAQTGLYSEDYQDEVYAGVDAWNSLIDEAGFDLEGVLRRRALVPFTLVPRHVSQRHGETETLSLLTLLQQAQDAFVCGVPFAALALMRAILEVVLKEHYNFVGADLDQLIKNSRGLPQSVHPARLHTLRTFANIVLHFKKEDEQRLATTESELVSLLLTLRALIEGVPRPSPGRHRSP